ncbi:MAG: winged helix-turn-helix domain-containing protein [Acidobacteria bacterium]|nr:winged helix-turn-helix domain-containing protein [Acidobacteriota bacterium]
MSDSNIFVFDQYMLAPDERLLLRDGQPVAVTPKTFDLLVVLVRNSGHLVGKDELLQQVWPDSFVEEVNLSVNISALRKALGGDQTAARFIETVPKRGYRFIAPVKRVGHDTAEIVFKRRLKIVAEIDESVAHQDVATSSEVILEGPSRLPSRRRIVLTVAAFLVIVVGAFLFWRMNAKHPAVQFDSLAVLPFTTVDASDEYLADGLSEATINGLAQLPKLRVAPRTSTFRYKRQPLRIFRADIFGTIEQKRDCRRASLHFTVRRKSIRTSLWLFRVLPTPIPP